jgi:hypothetical protein
MRRSHLLFGSPQEIATAKTNRAGIPVDVAIAAHGLRGVTIVPPGQERVIRSPLLLNLLPCSPEVAAMLNALGHSDLRRICRLPQGLLPAWERKDRTSNAWSEARDSGNCVPLKIRSDS